MKFLSVIAASFAAYASAQQKPSFRGATNSKYSPQKQNNRWQKGSQDNNRRQRPQRGGSKDNKGQFQWPQKNGSDNKGQFQWPQKNGSGQKGGSKNQWGQKGGSKDQWGQKGGSKDQSGQKGGSKGRYPQKGGSKESCPPKFSKELQKQYTDEFNALDVDGNHVLDGSEFKEAGDKISDAFKSFRKGKKPSWYHKRPSRSGYSKPNYGGNNQYGGKPKNGGKPNYGGNNQNGGNNKYGNRPSRNGGRRGRGGNDRRLDDESQNFMKYLMQHGFKPAQKPKTQDTKDSEDVKRAMQVFKKFDKDRNHKITLCEYENAMYRTQQMEKMLQSKSNGRSNGRYNRGSRYNKGNDPDVVVVHG